MSNKEKEIQEKYIQFQVLQQQAEQLTKYLEELEQKHLEFNQTVQQLKEFEKIPANTSTLIPLAAGIFVEGKLSENQELIVNVGANTLVKKTIPQIIKMITKQIDEVELAQMKLTQDIQKINLQINSLVKEIQKLS